jgi:hypothetical protein
MKSDSSLNPSQFNPDFRTAQKPTVLPRVEAPMPQRAESLDVESLRVGTEADAYEQEFSGLYDPNDIGYAFGEEPLYNIRDDLIE